MKSTPMIICINGKQVRHYPNGRFDLPKGWTPEDQTAFIKWIAERVQ